MQRVIEEKMVETRTDGKELKVTDVEIWRALLKTLCV